VTAEDLLRRGNSLLAAGIPAAQDVARTGTLEGLREAKRILISLQRDLRALKREASEFERGVKSHTQLARSDNANTGHLLGALFGGKTERYGARLRALRREEIRRTEAQLIEPYRQFRLAIDKKVGDIEADKDKLMKRIETVRGDRRLTAPWQAPPSDGSRSELKMFDDFRERVEADRARWAAEDAATWTES
jgi:hypothetical protein